MQSGAECVANGNLVISTGFEEVNGQSGINAPTDNYPFGTNYAEYWNTHNAGTQVVSDCGGRTAFAGDRYWHLQFRTGYLDPCLGTIPTSVNSHSNIGQDFAYPRGTQNRTSLDDVITSDTMTIRFVFRTTGNWTATNPTDNGGGLTFIRVFGNGGPGARAAALLKTMNDGDGQESRWYTYNPAGNPHDAIENTGIDTQDEDWHSVVYAVRINNRTGSENNITAIFWIDDWEMRGPGYSATITASEFGTNFSTIELFADWSAYPVDDMGLDIDQIEVWNGLPCCSGHGTCADGACACYTGYAGADCSACADGYEPSGDECVIPSNPCEGVSCSGHGSCAGGTCSCDTGYAKDDCSACADGYEKNGDECVIPSDPCDGVSCSGHGSCAGGTCNCDTGYAGNDCSVCADGYEKSGDECVPNSNRLVFSGFENVNGASGDYAPTVDYPFATTVQWRWQWHADRSEVLASCNGNRPYSGTHFYHHQFMMNHSGDTCLGTTTSGESIESFANIGLNLAYPLGSQQDFTLEGSASSNTLVFRCRFRCTGDWTSSNNVVDSGNGLKFVRVFGNGGSGDSAAALVKLRNDGDSTDPRWNLYDPSGPPYNHEYRAGVDVQDGAWHSLCFRVVRNNDVGSAGNITSSIWIDDWDMVGAPISQTITSSLFGDDFKYIQLFANWSGPGGHPDYPIAIDLDDLEVWDGMP